MRNVRGEARRGNARDRLGQSSVNPSAGSRARRKSTRFRRTISWRDLSRPSTKGARPDTSPRMYKREIKIDRERERGRGIRATSFLSARVQRVRIHRCRLVQKIFPIPCPVIRFRNREIWYSGRSRELVGIDRIWKKRKRKG